MNDGAKVINITNVVDDIKEEVGYITYLGENQIQIAAMLTRQKLLFGGWLLGPSRMQEHFVLQEINYNRNQ